MKCGKKKWVVYMLECGDGSYYTGITNNMDKRLRSHRAGKAARYTRGRLPVRLVRTEYRADRGKALKREWAIKRLSRREKESLIRNGDRL
jgi:putative endonuclease